MRVWVRTRKGRAGLKGKNGCETSDDGCGQAKRIYLNAPLYKTQKNSTLKAGTDAK